MQYAEGRQGAGRRGLRLLASDRMAYIARGNSMAFKLEHGLGFALAFAATAVGCDAKPKNAAVQANIGSPNTPPAQATGIAKPASAESAGQPAASVKKVSESPEERVTRLGGKIEREGSIVTRIDFFSTPVTDADLEMLQAFPDLQSLGLSSTKITDEGLEHLVGLNKLRNLSLVYTGITDRGLIALAKLPALQNVDLLRTKVTNRSVAELQKALPRLTINK